MSKVHYIGPGLNMLPLPCEMLDYVVDFLHDDKSALASCALTSRVFLAPSQLHLFNTLSFGWKENTGFGYITKFFLEHQHLIPYVRAINMSDEVDPIRSTSEWHNTICICTIIEILATLPRVRVFTLGGIVPVFKACCSTPPAYSYAPGTIQYLDLVDVRGLPHQATFQQVVRVLSLFSDIKSLHIVDTWFKEDEISEAQIGKDLAELSQGWNPSPLSLTLAGYNSGMLAPFSHLLTMRNTLRELEELNIVCHDPDDLHCAAKITRATSLGLITLTIDAAHVFWDEAEHVDDEEELELVTESCENVSLSVPVLDANISLCYS